MKTIKLYSAPTLNAQMTTELPVSEINNDFLTTYNNEFYKYGTYFIYKIDVTSKPTTKKGRKKNDT